MQFDRPPLIYKRASSLSSSNPFANKPTQNINAFSSASASSVAGKATTTARSSSSLPYVQVSNLRVDPTSTAASRTIKGTLPAGTASTPTSLVAASSKSISGGSIAGTVMGVLAAVAVIVAIVVFLVKRRRSKNKESTSARASCDMFHAYSTTVPIPPSNTHVPVAYQQQPGDGWQGETPLGVYTVTASYMPSLDDEIYVLPGDEVHIFAEYDDGWCLGLNVTRGRARGVFPKYCILPNSTSTTSSPQPQEGSGNNNNNHDGRRSISMLNSAAV